MPRVSICIPAYKPEYFEACLRSAIAQTYTDTEIIVSDDCPTEAIKDICNKFSAFVKYSRNPNPGLESNVLRLINIAQGEYIKFLFDDDIIHPFCTEYLFKALENTRSKGTTIACSPRYVIDGENNIIEFIDHFKLAEGKSTRVLDGRIYIKLSATHHANLMGEYTTVMFRRKDAFHEDGTFRLFPMVENKSPILIDMSAWMELCKIGNIAAHPFPLSYFRRHASATSNPDVGEHYVLVFTSWEEQLNMAFAGGYLPVEDLPTAYRNLLKLYRQWVGKFPELGPRIMAIENAMGDK